MNRTITGTRSARGKPQTLLNADASSPRVLLSGAPLMFIGILVG
jgi:hypothetical protein